MGADALMVVLLLTIFMTAQGDIVKSDTAKIFATMEECSLLKRQNEYHFAPAPYIARFQYCQQVEFVK